MTEIELKQAKENYKMLLEGRRILLESVANKAVSTFTKQYFSNVSEESIMSITKDEILRNAFLSTFGETKESSNLIIFLNQGLRINSNINDGQPEFVGIGCKQDSLLPMELSMHLLYCDLETNQPIIINAENPDEIRYRNKYFDWIPIPNYISKKENYYYSSTSLEKISKGSATEAFNRLQLYYFKQLLETSYEEAVTRIRKLTTKELEDICLDKEDIRIYK